MPEANTRQPTGVRPVCARCGEALQTALHLPSRLGQPAYDIFNCIACGFIAWVARGQEQRSREWS